MHLSRIQATGSGYAGGAADQARHLLSAICYLLSAICLVALPSSLTWRNWQTRTAQDRMGQPVEVRVLS